MPMQTSEGGGWCMAWPMWISDEIKKLPVYSYSYKDDPASTRHIGPMAQDVERVDPGAVMEDRRGRKMIDTKRVMGSILKAA